MSHAPLHDVTDFQIVGPYTLQITFDDATTQIINFEPVLYGALYGPLRDLTTFNQVRLDPETHNLIWPNEADFDPSDLYEWHEPGVGSSLIERAQQWRAQERVR